MTRASMALALGLLGLAGGCGSSAASTEPYCASVPGNFCDPAGFPFVAAVRSRSDACPLGGACADPVGQTTTDLSLPAPGKVCMKGTVAGREGFAWVIFEVSHWGQAEFNLVDAFDAKALGITELRFVVETPPDAGLTMFATVPNKRQCTTKGDCMTPFDLRTGPRSNVFKVMDQSGPVSAPFTDFVNADLNVPFDPTQLGHFIFTLGAGDYDFCISGFKFVDASGNEVRGSTPDGG